MKGFLENLELPTSLDELGVTEDMLPVLADEVSGNLANDKLSDKVDIVSQIYRCSLKRVQTLL